ncbi:MAG: HAMP domain-containing histidine kinase, partial [Myxococcales bacterium]|nr:HAMP domain-containing histidine kinase [Myxococcales bacterium]
GAREEAEKARVAGEAADRAKGELLEDMSHELRTPLNAVLGYVELLAEDARDDQIEDLGRVRTAGKHLLDLVDQVLDLARIEAGRVELELVEVDLGPLVSAALDELRPLAEDGGNHFGPAPVARVVVHADTLRVRQVVLNLLSNACKFTRGGVVSVELGVDGPFARLRVTDTGVGMEPEELERCFRPFEQGEAGRGQGTGLGLPISRRLCEAMGGGLTASSTPGVGTTFEVRLPLRQGPQASASHVKDASTPGS